ncbi:ArsR family transcriptional regulator [Litoreibacter ponti]|uniref:ArsR family transcriptional regulator n=1 Tax=Litoreibacter ponti TaxID=1510457 RepID=A0A2T6BK84_9RHOB|nr:helix-turn-helix domain-containing protein [Litoreibacter ponti]PTX56465.1 ArsR family transcriptional regulator [Litoreibacter ponti]
MDMIFKALGDPARRLILDSLRAKDGQTLSELEPQLEMTRFGVMKHLGVLEQAGLIVTRKQGRFKHHHLNALPLQEAIDRWIEPLLAKPAARAMIDLKTKLEGGTAMPETDTETPDFVMETFINCGQDALWAALTEGEQVPLYHFPGFVGRGTLSEAGDTLDMVAPDDNLILRHKLVKATPKTRLDVTFEPHWVEPNMEASRCSFLITPGAGADGIPCKLRLEHFSIPAGQEGVAEGWARVLSGLKSYLETGKQTNFAQAEVDA